MNNVIHLRSEDFFTSPGTKGNLLCTNIKDLSLVMFYANRDCKFCEELLPHFKKLPQIINGCKFCLLNINDNKNVIEMSKETIAKITYVPYIVFYVNGKPFLQYDDTANLDKLIEFVNYAMKLVATKKSFVDKGGKIESDIPAYSIGIPYNLVCDQDNNFCYLATNVAYKASPNPNKVQMAQQQFDQYKR